MDNDLYLLQIIVSVALSSTPLMEHSFDAWIVQHLAGRSLRTANLSEMSVYDPAAKPMTHLAPRSPGLRSSMAHGLGRKGTSFSSQSQAESTERSGSSLGESEDLESLEVKILDGLTLDRQVESNNIPYIVQCFALSTIRFAFEPARIVPLLRDYIAYSYSLGDEHRQTTLLISTISLEVSRSTDYSLTNFNTLKSQLVNRVEELRKRDDVELTRELAAEAMVYSHEFISTLWKVGSLANVLNAMGLYAPIFRRACPEPGDILVNLPRRLTAMEMTLKYYATLDILQSYITHRPMFFRYSLDFLSTQDETLIKLENGPGLRWLYGIPDPLMIVLAKINVLFEDFGSRVDTENVRRIEKEIEACISVISTGSASDASLLIGRTMVQESWKMAAKLYLYMSLCGANSADARVVKVQKGFMKLLRGIKPYRISDSFLVLPIITLGIATTSSTGRITLITRLWGISECTKPGTVANDLVRMLHDIWTHAKGRPTVWSDLRFASLRVTGM